MAKEEKNFYEPFEIVKFEKFCDDIVHVGRGLIIRINVNLARSYNDNRYFFYKEYEYTLNNYKRVSIKRGFDYYLSLEEVARPKDHDKIFIKIGLSDFYIFKQKLIDMIDWFTNSKYNKLFAKSGNELVIGMSSIPKTAMSFTNGMKVTFTPIVMGVGNDQIPGVNIELDNGKDMIDYAMSVDQLFAVHTALDGYNPFMSAQIMVGSMGIKLGTNRTNLDDASLGNPLPALIEEEKVKQGSSIEGRLIGGGKNLEDL